MSEWLVVQMLTKGERKEYRRDETQAAWKEKAMKERKSFWSIVRHCDDAPACDYVNAERPLHYAGSKQLISIDSTPNVIHGVYTRHCCRKFVVRIRLPCHFAILNPDILVLDHGIRR